MKQKTLQAVRKRRPRRLEFERKKCIRVYKVLELKITKYIRGDFFFKNQQLKEKSLSEAVCGEGGPRIESRRNVSTVLKLIFIGVIHSIQHK